MRGGTWETLEETGWGETRWNTGDNGTIRQRQEGAQRLCTHQHTNERMRCRWRRGGERNGTPLEGGKSHGGRNWKATPDTRGHHFKIKQEQQSRDHDTHMYRRCHYSVTSVLTAVKQWSFFAALRWILQQPLFCFMYCSLAPQRLPCFGLDVCVHRY